MGNIKEFGVGAENLSPKNLISSAKLAEELGFGTYWVPEDPFHLGAFALASAVASHTRSIRIGLGVINPYTRHPILIAMEVGALDRMSEGRTVLALGASIKSFIQGQFRIPYIKPNQAIRETVEIVKRLFQGEHLDYKGEVFQTSDVYLNFTPCRADLPINLGVVGPKNLELAGEISDGLLLSICAGPEYVEYAMEHVRRGARRSARSLDDFEVSAYLFVSISEDERAAREAVRPSIALMISLVGESPLFTCAGLEPKQIERFSDTFAQGEIPTHLVEDWMIDAFAIAGSPKQCRESLAKIVDAGVTHPVPFDVSGDTIEKIMRDVQTHLAPHFL